MYKGLILLPLQLKIRLFQGFLNQKFIYMNWQNQLLLVRYFSNPSYNKMSQLLFLIIIY